MSEPSAVVEASEYVQASWSTYEQIREARDQANGRADVAERELRAANASIVRARTLIEEDACRDACCGCSDCVGAICNVCRALVELGGSL